MTDTTSLIDRFSVSRRNPGHWDVMANGKREFSIRGQEGYVEVRDERGKEWSLFRFKTVIMAMAYIADQYMYEQPSEGTEK